MTATNLPYGVPTGQSCPVQSMNRPRPHCDNVGPTEIGLEPGEMTTAFGMDKAGLQGCCCQGCRDDGAEVLEVLDWQSFPPSAGQGGLKADPLATYAFLVVLPGEGRANWTVKTWARTADQAIRQVCKWQNIPIHFVRKVSRAED
jgi:hypothetical protein